MEMKVTFSQHAADQLIERDLSHEMVLSILDSPILTTADPNYSDRVRAYGVINERDGRIMRVVYVQKGDAFHVISAFLDRDAQRYFDVLNKSERSI